MLLNSELLKKHIQNIAEITKDALFPRQCYECRQPDIYLCDPCVGKLFNQQPICPHCSKRISFGNLENQCYKAFLSDRLFVASTYTRESVKKLFSDFKYRRAHTLAQPITKILVYWLIQNKYTDFINKDSLVIPVPSHKKRELDRGFHPSTQIAKSFALTFDIPINIRAVEKHKNIPFQTHIKNAKDRKENVKDCFILKDKNAIKGKTVILIDDIVTTGSTLKECAKTIRVAQPRQIVALAVARQSLS